MTADNLVVLGLAGGYPEAISPSAERRRRDWGRSYLEAVLTRDLRDIAEVDRLVELPRSARLVAKHAGRLVNYSQLRSSMGVTCKTSQRYVGLMEQVFLVATLPPWHTNAIKRIVKKLKPHFLDSGLLATSRGVASERVRSDRTILGALLKSFVFGEIMKLIVWSELRLTPYHFRDQDRNEVDIVLERDDGMIVGIEVKAGATVRATDFAGLRKLAGACGERFAFGAVLHDGDTIVPFGERLATVSPDHLWREEAAGRHAG